MKKLCFITTTYQTLEAFVTETAKHLYETEEYDISFICSADDDTYKKCPEYVHLIPINMQRGVSLSGIKAVFDFIKVFRKEKFDYIQYSTPNASLYASIASFLTKCPVRVYAQWGIRYVGSSGLGRKLLKIFEKISCMLSTHVRAVSHKNMQFAVSERLYKSRKAKVIGNGGTIGVSLEEFDISQKEALRVNTFKEFNIIDEAFIFGFIGRLSRDKGSEELLRAFKIIIEKGYNAKLFLVGNNEINGIDSKISEWTSRNKNVIITGSYPKSELIKFYAAFDCYVHPTYREGFGMVLQEAGAMGNAIITTDIPGASEVMEDGISCILVKPRDYIELANAMEYVINNREYVNKLGEMAYKRTCELYERSIMLNNIQKDIEEILGE